MTYRMLLSLVLILPLTAVAKKGAAGAGVDPEAAYQKMISLNKMRETLAATLDGRSVPIDETMFKETCGKVGQELQSWAAEKHLTVRQASDRNRGPSNGASDKDLRAIEMFRADPKLDRTMDGKKLYVRIPVVQACLHCHGERESRPRFIKEKYPLDKAFGYKPGDVRGVYSVNF